MTTLTYQERFKTLQGVFDEFTNRTIFTLQSKGVFDELVSPLKVGKESNVFVAVKGEERVIVKIYRMQNCDFKRMFGYIKKDPRYEFLKSQRRQIILSWTQREYKNLLRADRGKVRVPKALAWRNHIIVEEFIGGEEAAPPLKDAPPKDPAAFLEDLLKEMRKMYKGGLIHGDLSSFNILNLDEKPVIIDFSQGTLIKSPNSQELLERDITNVLRFFEKQGIHKDKEKVFKRITGSK
ncbi:serine/threonine protein kinase [Candidatus Woesearchaeota archaeon CG10_big_fil_rev_8_21_14_0_10_45_16]|nr:MAG: serine/threonine protein kinase [Candidatus Woesearchaeota archaeon CG10_big_fil_rev_8_21_14_0_10_45_16]